MSIPLSVTAKEHFVLVFFVFLVICMFVMIIKSFVSFRKSLDDIPEQSDDKSLTKPEATTAKVISKRIDKHYEGSYKMPDFVEDYYITFLTENGVETELSVFVEVFDAITVGQEGTLVTLNGKFFDFGDGEEITE